MYDFFSSLFQLKAFPPYIFIFNSNFQNKSKRILIIFNNKTEILLKTFHTKTLLEINYGNFCLTIFFIRFNTHDRVKLFKTVIKAKCLKWSLFTYILFCQLHLWLRSNEHMRRKRSRLRHPFQKHHALTWIIQNGKE